MAVSRIHSSNARIYLGTTGLKGITKYDFSFDQEVTTLQGLGDYHISNRIKNPNQKIDFSLSWILATGSNDPFYDFRNSNSGFISVQKFDFTIKDLVGSNFISGAYLTSYSVSASVGNLVEGSLKYEADGLFYSTGDNLLITDQTSDSYSPLLPSNIDVSFSGSANTVSLSGFAIQSFSFEIPIQRKPITLLGQTVPSYRYPQLPITAPIRFSVVKNQITGINFSNLILPTGSIVFGLKDCRLKGYTYSFNNASLKSISESLGIDGNAQLDFNYEASITDNVGSRSFDRVSTFETESNVSSLNSLVLTGGGTLSPTFAAGTLSYTATVTNATASVTLTPTVTDGTSTVTVNSTPVTSGAASGSLTLNVGLNTLTTVVTAGNGSTTTYIVTVTRAAAVAPSALTYSTNPATYTNGTTITNNTPTNSGGAVVSYSVSPALPTGLTLSTSTGVISGTPTVVVAATNYTVTATNTGGSTTASVNITIASAITLGWGTPVAVNNAADTIVDTGGTFVNAFRFGSTNNLTINGVTFTGTNTGGTSYNDPALFATYGSASANLQSLLQNLIYGLSGDIRTITGLTSGRTYMLQWFFADERASVNTRNQIVTIDSYSITFPAQLTAKATKCYFVATGSSMSLTITGGENGHIEAYQIRDVT